MKLETFMLVGGQGSGKLYNISKRAKSIRVPVHIATVLTAEPYDTTTFSEIGYEIYERRQYTDANKTTKNFLVLQSLSDEQAAAELYLLGILNIDENYEPETAA